ncbi:MAG: tripartite tricarboxylate transporter TctB family protein [Proteobacteria bacterium]|nr:tripartite tricarboxylate transporter TctB family protein [Pseudomonadota bacterium]
MNADARQEMMIGAAVMAIAAGFYFAVIPSGIVMPSGTESRALAPDFWPRIVVVVAALSGVCMVVHGWLHRAQASPAADKPTHKSTGIAAWIRIAGAFAAMLACYYLLPLGGMILPTAVLGLFLMWLGGERRWKVMAPTAILLPILLHLFFADFAKVPLPLGIFAGLL